MRILATGDWQASLDNLPECQASLKQLLDIINDREVDLVLLLGDLKEAFNPVDQRVTNFLLEMAYSLRRACRLVFVIPGNHDHIGVNDQSPTCLPILAAAGIQTFEHPGSIQLASEANLSLIPFRRDTKAFFSDLRSVSKHKRFGLDLLAIHQEVAGSQLSATYKSKDGLPIRKLKGYDLCLSGHIHNPQQIENLIYVGSPFCHDWSEVNQRKRFLLVTIGHKSIKTESIWSELPGWYDPELPGYLPKDWKGTHVRADSSLSETECKAKYPGATLHFVPKEAATKSTEGTFRIADSDRSLILQYLAANPPESKPEALLAYLLSKLQTNRAVVGELKFRSVEATNLLCFRKAALKLDHPGITLVTGRDLDWDGRSNGSGKSSLLGLPLTAIFGVSPKGQAHDALVCNKETGNETRVELLLQDGSRRTHKISRQRNPPALRYWINQDEQTMGTIPGTQQRIEASLELSWDAACNALYIGQQELATVLSGTDKQRKELFSRFLKLDRFLAASDAIRKDMKLVERRLEETQLWKSAAEEAAAVLETVFANVQSAPPLRAAKRDLAVAANELNRLTKESRRYQDLWVSQKEAVEVVRSKRDHLANRISRLAERVRTAETQLNAIEKAKVGTCPTCGQKVAESWTAAAKEARRAKVTHLQRILDKRRGKHAAANQELITALNQERSLFEKLGKINVKIPEMSALAASLEAAVGKAGEKQRLQTRIRKNARIVGYHTNAIVAFEQDRKFLEEALTVVSRNGLPSFLCTTACPALSAAAAEYSSLLTDSRIKVLFVAQEGEVDVQIENQNGGNSILDQSHGESRLAGLIASLAMRQVLGAYNLLILDEPGEGLDSQNAEVFARSLNQVASRFGSLYLTTHNPFILGNLKQDRHLEVVKSKGVSTVKEIL